MAEKLEFEGGEPEGFANWPAFLEKGTEVHGVITGFSDYRATETYESNAGVAYLKANLVMRIVDHDGLNGYHIRDGIQIPTDGERFLGTQQVRDILFHKLAPFGIKLTEVPIPTTPLDMVNMVEGKEEWEETGGMIGKPITMICGKPTKPYTNKDGEEKGPFTTFGYFRTIDENVFAVLKQDFDACAAEWEATKKFEQAAGAGGVDDDDDLPF